MSDEILKQIADKLGTTSEYLWSVLIKQAPISGVFDILFWGFTAGMIYATVRFYKFIHFKCKEDNWDEIAYMWPAAATLVTSIFVIACLESAATTFAAFFNPEYWALNHILSSIKK